MVEWLTPVLKSIGDAKVADVLREKVGLLEHQLRQATSQRDSLAVEKAVLTEQIGKLESELCQANAELQEARQEIERLAPNAQQGCADRPEPQHSLLILLGNRTTAESEELATCLGTGREAIAYHTRELERLRLIHFRVRHCLPSQGKSGWELLHDGRQHLVERGLLR